MKVWISKYALSAMLFAFCLSLTGCADDGKALHKILKQCRSNVAVTIHYSFWGKSAEFRCDDMPMEDGEAK